MIPGASARIPEKRWSAAHYAALARSLALPAVVVGGPAEQALAGRAAFAVGNDTGPTHLVAACFCPTLALFGPRSDPSRSAPRGAATAVLPVADLDARDVAAVRAALAGLAPAADLAPPVSPAATSG